MSAEPHSETRQQRPVQEQQTQEWYRVYIPEIDSVAHDPLDPGKRYHVGIWVETDPKNRKGRLFNVTGDVIAANGMRYEEKIDWSPGQTGPVHNLTHLGYVSKTDYDSGRISTVLQALPTPSRQQGINFWERDPVTGRHEMIWTREDGEPYAPGEEHRPVFKCNEWTALYAIPALQKAGLLQQTR